MLTYTGSSLKGVLAKALKFYDANGNLKEIKKVSAKIAKDRTVTLKSIKFTDGSKLKKADLSGIKITLAAREVSANSATNAKGAVVYGKVNTSKTKIKDGKLKKLMIDLPNWDKNATDATESSLKSGKQYLTKKVGKNDIESAEVKDNQITVKFKNNYKGTVTFIVQ